MIETLHIDRAYQLKNIQHFFHYLGADGRFYGITNKLNQAHDESLKVLTQGSNIQKYVLQSNEALPNSLSQLLVSIRMWQHIKEFVDEAHKIL